jgi:hypothetical protein
MKHEMMLLLLLMVVVKKPLQRFWKNGKLGPDSSISTTITMN